MTSDRRGGLNMDRLRERMDEENQRNGERVRARRIALGLTQKQLAELVSVPFQTISKIERGDIVPRDYLKGALALRLVCEVDQLFGWPTRESLARAS